MPHNLWAKEQIKEQASVIFNILWGGVCVGACRIKGPPQTSKTSTFLDFVWVCYMLVFLWFLMDRDSRFSLYQMPLCVATPRFLIVSLSLSVNLLFYSSLKSRQYMSQYWLRQWVSILAKYSQYLANVSKYIQHWPGIFCQWSHNIEQYMNVSIVNKSFFILWWS